MITDEKWENSFSWLYISNRKDAGEELDPLEEFIYENEPARMDKEFRARLLKALNFSIEEWR